MKQILITRSLSKTVEPQIFLYNPDYMSFDGLPLTFSKFMDLKATSIDLTTPDMEPVT